jgi:dephospho-CoA kinase
VGRWVNKFVIGLTGNIAVGKSVVRQMLQHLGAYPIDADGLTHQVLAPGAPAYQPIINTFGQFILNAEKQIDRAALAKIVFNNPEALAKLEAITHPIIGQGINMLISRAQQKVIVIEAIKLLEGDLAKAVDAVWVVNAAPQSQYRRLLEKRKMSEAEAQMRIRAQGAQADKLTKANFVVQNDGNLEETWKQVQNGWNTLPAPFRAVAQAPAPQAPAAQPPAAPQPPSAAQGAANTKMLPTVQATPMPQPTRPPVAPPAPAAQPVALSVTVKRGMPPNAEQIAKLISSMSGRNVSRMDIMQAFGEKSYLLAQDVNGKSIAVMGWQVENLITRVDEFYIENGLPVQPITVALIHAIEEASKELQSEVAFIFLPPSTGQETVAAFLSNGYEKTQISEIKFPAWREALQEFASTNMLIYRKQLRADRVLKPI